MGQTPGAAPASGRRGGAGGDVWWAAPADGRLRAGRRAMEVAGTGCRFWLQAPAVARAHRRTCARQL